MNQGQSTGPVACLAGSSGGFSGAIGGMGKEADPCDMLPSEVSDISDVECDLVVAFEDKLVLEFSQLDREEENPSEDDSGSSTLGVCRSRVAVRLCAVAAHKRTASWIISSLGIGLVRTAISSLA